jgi:hypothetical protein
MKTDLNKSKKLTFDDKSHSSDPSFEISENLKSSQNNIKKIEFIYSWMT